MSEPFALLAEIGDLSVIAMERAADIRCRAR